MDKYFPMHEGAIVDAANDPPSWHLAEEMRADKGQLDQMIEAGLLVKEAIRETADVDGIDLTEAEATALLEESGENFQLADSDPEEGPALSKLALLHAVHEVDFPRWESYLRALGYDVATTQELVEREILKAVAVADLVVVTQGWYTDPISNLVLLLGRFVGAKLQAGWDNQVAGGAGTVQGLFDIEGASINPTETGRLLRNG